MEYEWTGVMAELHAFCAADLSAFYFDVRKDSLYCDRPDALRRRACRTVLDHLHRCLCIWLAPVLCFTAEDAWTARFGESDSVHLQILPDLPPAWRDEALGARMAQIREQRGSITTEVEALRRDGSIGASLQAQVALTAGLDLLDAAGWEEIAIVSRVTRGETLAASPAPGRKCERCWRVLEEVGTQPGHPALCARCADAVDSSPLCREAA
jgi:isoleucyl-tRNA synthetase